MPLAETAAVGQRAFYLADAGPRGGGIESGATGTFAPGEIAGAEYAGLRSQLDPEQSGNDGFGLRRNDCRGEETPLLRRIVRAGGQQQGRNSDECLF